MAGCHGFLSGVGILGGRVRHPLVESHLHYLAPEIMSQYPTRSLPRNHQNFIVSSRTLPILVLIALHVPFRDLSVTLLALILLLGSRLS